MTEENPNTKRQWLWEQCTPENLLIFLIFVGGVIMLILAGILLHEALSMWWDGSELKNSYDLLRVLILSIGGVGAAIALWFSRERLDTFLAQLQVQIDQDFNDRLGRGVKLLADENVVIRSAGVRALVDLADNANDEQKPLVANIIYDFFHEKIRIRRGNNDKRLEEEVGQDMQNALDFLINLSLDERDKLLPQRLTGGRLDFHNLDFSYLDFINKNLKKIDFSGSRFCEITLERGAIIEDVKFSDAKIASATFTEIEIRDSAFVNGEIMGITFSQLTIKNSNFSSAKIEQTSFFDVKIVGSEFNDAQFIGGRFAGNVTLSSRDNLPKFICTEFFYTGFDSPDEINSDDIFELCYYHKDVQITFNLNKNRGYISTLGMKVFVESDKPWSGQPVEARIALEIAEWKFEQTKETSTNIDEQKADIAALANELKAAEAQLQRRRDKFNNP